MTSVHSARSQPEIRCGRTGTGTDSDEQALFNYDNSRYMWPIVFDARAIKNDRPYSCVVGASTQERRNEGCRKEI